MTVPVAISKRAEKSDIYMFGHVVLPTLLYEHPELAVRIGLEDGLAYLEELYKAYVASWGGTSTLVGTVIRRYRSTGGLIAIVIDLPKPQVVPEPHAAVLVLSPERLYFVVEKAGEDHIRRHRSEAWVVMSSTAEPSLPGDRYGYVCTWLPDRSHFNHALLKLDVKTILDCVSTVLDTQGPWTLCDVHTFVNMTQLSVHAPIHAMHRPLPKEEATSLAMAVASITSSAHTAAEKSAAAMQITNLIKQARAKYGEWSAEITLHNAAVIRLYLEAGDDQRAVNVAKQWVKYCHRYRGSRAPETRIAYTWSARAYIADRTLSPDDKQRRVDAQLRVRNAVSQTMDTTLPGAEDPNVSAEVASSE
jgi:hypothetical protein